MPGWEEQRFGFMTVLCVHENVKVTIDTGSAISATMKSSKGKLITALL